MNTFSKMIERMEDLVLSGASLPLTPLTMVNSEKLVPLLDRIRESLPDEIRQSQRVLDQREELLLEAQQRANQILLDAKNQAEALLSESELLKAVHQEAERVRQQILSEIDAVRKKAHEETEALKARAYEEARQVRDGADQYADSILGSLDKSLSEFHAVVRNGQKHLKRTRLDAHASNHAKSAYATQPVTPALSPLTAQTPYATAQMAGGQPQGAFPQNPLNAALNGSLNNAPSAYQPELVGAAAGSSSPSSAVPSERARIEAFLKQTTL